MGAPEGLGAGAPVLGAEAAEAAQEGQQVVAGRREDVPGGHRATCAQHPSRDNDWEPRELVVLVQRLPGLGVPEGSAWLGLELDVVGEGGEARPGLLRGGAQGLGERWGRVWPTEISFFVTSREKSH